jgi:hypothetical protein
VITAFAGTGSAGHEDGIGAAASFYRPSGLTLVGKNLYIADCNNNTIRKIHIATREATTMAGTALMSGSTNGACSAALFNGP